MAPKKQPNNSIQVTNARPISPHTKALYEAGKTILLDSLDTGREFCKSMVGVSNGAIPIYLGILTFMLPKEYVLGTGAGWPIAAPAIGFLVAAAIFASGYLPGRGEMSLDDVDGIERERRRIIQRRLTFGWAGLIIFLFSTLGAIRAIILNIGVR